MVIKLEATSLDCIPPPVTCDNGVAGTTGTAAGNGKTAGNVEPIGTGATGDKTTTGSTSLDCIPPPVTCDNGVAGTTGTGCRQREDCR